MRSNNGKPTAASSSTFFMAAIKHIHIRPWAARILLAVFLPMLLLSSAHLHLQETAAPTTECYACEHHLHHDGHISTAQHLQKCVLCQFLTLPFLTATINGCPAPWMQPVPVQGQPDQSAVVLPAQNFGTRGPPAGVSF